MLSPTQRERIVSHLQHGWKLPDSLVQELWEAYEALERHHQGPKPHDHPTHSELHQAERRQATSR
ncbi:MAG: hypothetical protein AB4911_15370 [Oscillochloridaceae bacterium umkhey_bin13]